MDQLKGMSRSSHLLVWGGVLLFIFLFFDWQQYCVPNTSACVGRSGWHGWGVLVGILTIALLAFEIALLVGVTLPELPVKAVMISAGLAAGILLFTVIKFLVDNEVRHWPAWIGLVLAIVIGGGGVLRWQGDNVREVDFNRSPASPPAAPPPAESPPAEPPSAEPPAS